ncbi:homocysteine S-methyltransferase YbgG-like [Apostichopus japonicus]|uniref:homocysteine S-methyltransferase YbgG-like n=1 Tax=Stichopus japonicus TaxID=307972 RepID=UPI003AB3830B
MDVLVLDGGASSEIQNLGFDIHKDPLWSSRLLITNPGAIKEVHKSFLEHGADIIQTVSYQASIPGFWKYANKTEEEAKALMQKSVHLAQESVEEFWKDYQKKAEDSDSTITADRKRPMVCGSLGPCAVKFNNNSEYHGNYIEDVTEREIIDFQRPRISALVEAGIDFLALETIPVQKEAEIVTKLLREFPNVKPWISFQCKDGNHTGHGEVFSDAVQSVVQDGLVKYVGINCCSPLYVTPLLESVQRQIKDYSLEFVTYPNSGEIYEEEAITSVGRFTGDNLMAKFAPTVPKWIDLGATIIGGCCQTTPKDIQLIVEHVSLNLKGHQSTKGET